MALNVKFLQGRSTQYNSLNPKDPNAFYYTTDDSQLYLGSIKLSNANDLSNAVNEITQNRQEIAAIQQQLQGLVGGGTGSISDMINEALAPVKANIGILDDLNTSAKTNLVEAINELHSGNNKVEEAGKVTVEKASEVNGHLHSYTIKQGSAVVGIIDIPKDLVVESGKVVDNPVGQPQGTYIELTLKNDNNQKIYINVGQLIDIYTVQASATEVQLAMNNREISATIVNGSVTNDKLAANAVTTVKIKDSNVTKAKLSTNLQESINRADTAVQVIETGTAEGTISVDGNSVKVAGLKSAAYVDTSDITEAAEEVRNELNAYKSANDTKVNNNTSAIDAINNSNTGILAQAKDYADQQDAEKDAETLAQAKSYADNLAGNYATAAQGAKADTALQQADIVEGSVNGAILVKNSSVAVHGLGTAAYTESTAYDTAGSANAAKEAAVNEAKAYVDKALTWGVIA